MVLKKPFVSTSIGYTPLQCEKGCCCITNVLIKNITTFYLVFNFDSRSSAVSLFGTFRKTLALYDY